MITFDLYKIILILTGIILLFKVIHGHKHEIKGFNFFILFVCSFELAFLPISKYVNGNNVHLYNIYAILCVFFYLHTYINLIQKPFLERIFKLCFFIFIIISITNFIINYNTNLIINKTYILGMFLVGVLIVIFLKRGIDEINFNFVRSGSFYFSLGLLIFITTSFPLLAFYQELIYSKSAILAYNHLLKIGNAFLSLSYFISTLCMKKAV